MWATAYYLRVYLSNAYRYLAINQDTAPFFQRKQTSPALWAITLFAQIMSNAWSNSARIQQQLRYFTYKLSGKKAGELLCQKKNAFFLFLSYNVIDHKLFLLINKMDLDVRNINQRLLVSMVLNTIQNSVRKILLIIDIIAQLFSSRYHFQ